MDNQSKQKLKGIIIAKIKQAEDDIVDLEEMTKPVAPENAIGRISRMDAINNKGVNEAALAQTRARLLRLQMAIQNVDKPSFGLCVRCGNPIPFGRLVSMPETTKCTNCS